MQKGWRDEEEPANERPFARFFQSEYRLLTYVYHSVYQSTRVERSYSVNRISFYHYFNLTLKISYKYIMYLDYIYLYSLP